MYDRINKNSFSSEHKNIKAFITHGGMMSTQEAVFHGIPMIALPVFADQHINIRNYVEQKIAVSLDLFKIDGVSLTRVIIDVLKNPIYR